MKKLFSKIVLFLVRFVYLVVGLFLYYMEIMGNWFIGYNKKTEYIKKGSCNQCGKCCKLLAIQYPNFFNKLLWLKNLCIKWHKWRYGFLYHGAEDNYFMYSCNNLDENNRCTIYSLRPRLCREYPKLKVYGKAPTYALCGYYFKSRDGSPCFDEALRSENSKRKM